MTRPALFLCVTFLFGVITRAAGTFRPLATVPFLETCPLCF